MSILKKADILWRQRASLRSILRHTRPGFSQYGEDIIYENLMRPGKKGTYIDVGAHHPVDGSNTFRLYLRGWRGIAIDPNPDCAEQFAKYRSRDLFLREGVALNPEMLTYHAFEDSVHNTFDQALASIRIEKGQKLLSQTPVNCRPLADIVEESLNGKHIDLLNIDCEGLDTDVLISLDLSKRRPTSIIIEDYARYRTFQRGLPPMPLEELLRSKHYMPIAQTAWSGIYVAEDWKDLFLLSEAFDENRVQNGYLPHQ